MWTSSPSVRNPNRAWAFNYGVGFASSDDKAATHHVRLVRECRDLCHLGSGIGQITWHGSDRGLVLSCGGMLFKN